MHFIFQVTTQLQVCFLWAFYADKLGYIQSFVISSMNVLYFRKFILIWKTKKIDIHRLPLSKLAMALTKAFASSIYFSLISVLCLKQGT